MKNHKCIREPNFHRVIHRAYCININGNLKGDKSAVVACFINNVMKVVIMIIIKNNLFVCKGDSAIIVQLCLEGKTTQMESVLKIHMIPLNNKRCA